MTKKLEVYQIKMLMYCDMFDIIWSVRCARFTSPHLHCTGWTHWWETLSKILLSLTFHGEGQQHLEYQLTDTEREEAGRGGEKYNRIMRRM